MAQVDPGAPARPHTPVSPVGDPWKSAGRDQRRISRGSLASPHRQVPYLRSPQPRLHQAPGSPVEISPPTPNIREPDAASIKDAPWDSDSIRSSWRAATPDSGGFRESGVASPRADRRPSDHGRTRQSEDGRHSRASSGSAPPPPIAEFGPEGDAQEEQAESGLTYHGFDDSPTEVDGEHKDTRQSQMATRTSESRSSGDRQSRFLAPRTTINRPVSAYTFGSDRHGRAWSPMGLQGSSDAGSPRSSARDLSSSRRSPLGRPVSYIDLLNNVPHHQPIAPGPPRNNADLQGIVGSAASLLDTKQTLDMYRANVKRTTDAAVQYEFAVFMVTAAKDAPPADDLDPAQLYAEAKHILQRLSDRAYPFAQYYLGDGYFSGLFNKNRPDYDKAFPLFVAASKHGHAEAGYRAALCYEFGWGTTPSYPKAVQFYRAAASRNHPGAATRLGLACIRGDMGLVAKHAYREGVKWLKRATESADVQYNAAPYELGRLHLTGFGEDIFRDEAYAAQLLTQAAELGHVRANFAMGEAYENGLYSCPRDAALSVHFYTGAATRGLPEAMMALCAWYMLGAPPVLDRDEAEAYAWATLAAEAGLVKAEYACGYFTEMGIGCRRDPLQANVWYVSAAESGSEQARQRLRIISQAAEGMPEGVVGVRMEKGDAKTRELGAREKKRFLGIF